MTKQEVIVIIKEEFGSYNSRRYSKPWGAIVTFDGNYKAEYDFVGTYAGSDNGGKVILNAKIGDIVAFGQKDNRGNGTKNYWCVVEPDGSLATVTREWAVEYWIEKITTPVVEETATEEETTPLLDDGKQRYTEEVTVYDEKVRVTVVDGEKYVSMIDVQKALGVKRHELYTRIINECSDVIKKVLIRGSRSSNWTNVINMGDLIIALRLKKEMGVLNVFTPVYRAIIESFARTMTKEERKLLIDRVNSTIGLYALGAA